MQKYCLIEEQTKRSSQPHAGKKEGSCETPLLLPVAGDSHPILLLQPVAGDSQPHRAEVLPHRQRGAHNPTQVKKEGSCETLLLQPVGGDSPPHCAEVLPHRHRQSHCHPQVTNKAAGGLYYFYRTATPFYHYNWWVGRVHPTMQKYCLIEAQTKRSSQPHAGKKEGSSETLQLQTVGVDGPPLCAEVSPHRHRQSSQPPAGNKQCSCETLLLNAAKIKDSKTTFEIVFIF
jgi:hypothetical protein